MSRLLCDVRVRAAVTPEDLARELERAVCANDEDLARTLLEHGAPADTRGALGHTLLHKATMRGCTSIVAALLDHGAMLDATDDRGRTALCHAVMENWPKTGVFLLERGTDPNVCNDRRASPLHHAVRVPLIGMIHKLLQHGAAVNVQDALGATPLINAQFLQHGRTYRYSRKGERRDVCVTRLLLEYGADRSLADKRGRTARHRASPHVRQLLDAYFPCKLQMQQLLLGLRGPTPSSLTRFASHPIFDPEVLPFIAAFLSGKGSNAFNEHQRAAEHGHEDDSSSSSPATTSSALPTSSAAKKFRLF